MKKQLLSIIGFLGLSMGLLNAQTGRKATQRGDVLVINHNLTASKTYTGQTCDSIVNFAQTATISVGVAGTDTATPGCDPYAGYVCGTNCYGDKEKANFYDGSYYGSITNNSITALKVLLYSDIANGQGTMGGGSASIGVKIYNGNNTSGPSGAYLGSLTEPMATVLSSTSSSSSFFFHTFTFLTPVQVASTGFFASVVIPDGTVTGDTAVIASEVTPTANVAWEMFNTNAWYAFTNSQSWQENGNMIIIPKFCFDLSGVGISQNLGIQNHIDIYPNPSNGIVKIATGFDKQEDLEISIINSIGQTVRSYDQRNTTVKILTYDISDLDNGLYFISIKSGNDKMVSKVLLNK